MAVSKRNALVIVSAIFLGIIAGLIISANFDLLFDGFVSDNKAIETSTVDSIESGTETVDSDSEYEPVVAQNQTKSGYNHLLEIEKAYVQTAENVKPWVVTITSTKIYRYRQYNPFDLFDFFGNRGRQRDQQGDQNNEQEYTQQGLGSGVIVSGDGYILTNNHVVKDADEIRVFTYDNKEYTAKLVGRDEKTDVAVVKIECEDSPFAKLGDSEDIRVGQIVMAIGNPFSQRLQHTVTEGIISAKGRANIGLSDYEDFIQTTAAINPGNSGGALVNLQGQLIGINTAILSRSGGFNGIGFAIPVNMAKHIMEMLIDKGYVVRGYLGVGIQQVDDDMAQVLGLPETNGALISSVEPDFPAEKAGIQAQDVVLEMDGKLIEDNIDFRLRIAEHKPGDKVSLKIFRDGKIKMITVKLAERPGDRVADVTSKKESKNLGISVSNLTQNRARQYGFRDEEGILVVDVKQSSNAWRKGLRKGDLITSINRQAVKSVRDYDNILTKYDAGDLLLIRIKRQIGNSISQLYFTIRIPS